jgi:DNA-directed RNA polymerase subunit RPC12/RpoP
MTMRCPGQDMNKLRVDLFKCPSCGSEVEIFSDETRVRCQKCATMVFKERLPSCIEWCASARQCLGEERWKALMGNKEVTEKRPELTDNPATKRIEEIKKWQSKRSEK